MGEWLKARPRNGEQAEGDPSSMLPACDVLNFIYLTDFIRPKLEQLTLDRTAICK